MLLVSLMVIEVIFGDISNSNCAFRIFTGVTVDSVLLLVLNASKFQCYSTRIYQMQVQQLLNFQLERFQDSCKL